MNDHVEVVKFLLAEADYKQEIGYGRNKSSPLHVACMHGKLQVVRFLVRDLLVDASMADKSENHVLLLACRNGHVDVVQYLVEEGNADTDCVCSRGSNALMLACYFGHINVVRYLICQNCVNVNLISVINERYSRGAVAALHIAVRHGYLEIVRYLVMYGQADLELRTTHGTTALQIAQTSENLAMVEQLLELGATVDKPEVEIDENNWQKFLACVAFIDGYPKKCTTKKEWNRRGEYTVVCNCVHIF